MGKEMLKIPAKHFVSTIKTDNNIKQQISLQLCWDKPALIA